MNAERRPPGYPVAFERQIALRDGRTVSVRPIVPEDAPELADAIRTADSDTLHRRFLGGAPRVTARLLDYLTVLDYRTRFALVARDPQTGRGVAVARYDLLQPGTAEIAVAVDPDWRRIGLATALVHLLGEAALQHGIHTFTAVYLAANRPVAALVADAGGASLIKEGIAELEVALPDQDDQDDPRRTPHRQPAPGPSTTRPSTTKPSKTRPSTTRPSST